MSKAETIDALMESAIHCFSQHGYEGAALRDIAAEAGVPLSTIHMYFGSKAELYTAIERKAWIEIADERTSLLTAALSKAGDRRLELADVIHALAYPVVRRALASSDHERQRIFIVRDGVSGRVAANRKHRIDLADRSRVRWIDAMATACPLETPKRPYWSSMATSVLG
jgi:AcrR family transcriptional regulator